MVDHIVFTAGDRLATAPLAENTLESIQRAGQIRFFAPLLVAKVGRRYLRGEAQSSIVLTTGGVADRPVPNVSLYLSFLRIIRGKGEADFGTVECSSVLFSRIAWHDEESSVGFEADQSQSRVTWCY
jgi:hypothetical protein